MLKRRDDVLSLGTRAPPGPRWSRPGTGSPSASGLPAACGRCPPPGRATVESLAAGLRPHHLPVGQRERAVERRRQRLAGRHGRSPRVAQPVRAVVGVQLRDAEARERGEVAQGQLDLLVCGERGKQFAGSGTSLTGRDSATAVRARRIWTPATLVAACAEADRPAAAMIRARAETTDAAARRRRGGVNIGSSSGQLAVYQPSYELKFMGIPQTRTNQALGRFSGIHVSLTKF